MPAVICLLISQDACRSRSNVPHISSSRVQKLRAGILEAAEHLAERSMEFNSFLRIINDLSPFPVRHVHLLEPGLPLLHPGVILALGEESCILFLPVEHSSLYLRSDLRGHAPTAAPDGLSRCPDPA